MIRSRPARCSASRARSIRKVARVAWVGDGIPTASHRAREPCSSVIARRISSWPQRVVGRLTDEKSEPAPAPVAVHLDQAGGVHPPELLIDGGQQVFGIASRSPDPSVELLLQFRCCALN